MKTNKTYLCPIKRGRGLTCPLTWLNITETSIFIEKENKISSIFAIICRIQNRIRIRYFTKRIRNTGICLNLFPSGLVFLFTCFLLVWYHYSPVSFWSGITIHLFPSGLVFQFTCFLLVWYPYDGGMCILHLNSPALKTNK